MKVNFQLIFSTKYVFMYRKRFLDSFNGMPIKIIMADRNEAVNFIRSMRKLYAKLCVIMDNVNYICAFQVGYE